MLYRFECKAMVSFDWFVKGTIILVLLKRKILLRGESFEATYSKLSSWL